MMLKNFFVSFFLIAINLIVIGQGGFVENKGQIDNGEEKIFFKKEDPNYNLYITENGLMFHFYKIEEKSKNEYTKEETEAYKLGNYASIRKKTFFLRADINLLSANFSQPVMLDEQEMKRNFYLSSCPDGILNVKSYKKIIFKNAYPNIDFVIYEDDKANLKYDFIINPGGNIENIKMEYKGFDDYKLKDHNKSIHLNTKIGVLKDEGLKSFYKEETNKKVPVQFVIKDGVVSILAGDFDKTQTLIIDPVLTWSTFYNDGSSYTQYTNPQFDAVGNMYNVGYTSSSIFPVLNAGGGQWFDGVRDGFNELVVVKFNTNGSQAFATYYGGANYEYLPVDYGKCISVDSVGSLYIVGYTSGSNPVNFPTFNPGGGAFYQDQSYIYGFGDNSFILKFDQNGVREWATIFQHQQANTNPGGIKLTGIYAYRGKIYFTGSSTRANGNDVPLTTLSGAYNNSTFVGSEDIIVGRFSSSYALEWCSYMNNGDVTRNDYTYGGDLTGDKNGNLYLTARSLSAHNLFGSYTPTKNLTVNPGGGAYYQNANTGGWGDVYIARFNSSLNVTWATYFGGSNGDVPSAIATDTNGNVYGVMRGTGSYDIPTINPGGGAYYQSSPNSSSSGNTDYREGFIFKFSITGALNWATYFGGAGATCENYLGGIAVDKKNQVYISGFANNIVTFPTLSQVGSYYDATPGGTTDLFYGKFNENGVQQWTTLFGGNNNDNSLYNRTSLFDDGPCGTQLTTFAGTLSSNFPVLNPGGGALYQASATTSNFTNVIVSFYNAGSSLIDTNTTSLAAICETGTKGLTSSVGGGTWSVVSGGGTIIGTTYTPANVTVNTTVTVRYTDACGNTSDRSFTVNVNNVANNTTSTASICELGTKALTATPGGGTWSVVSGGGSISGTSYTAPNVSSNTSVTIKYRIPGSGSCPADSSNVTFIVTNTVSANNTTSTASICELGTKALTATPGGGTWSVVSGGGSITGTTYTAPNVASNTSVTIKYRTPGTGGCPADSTNVTFTVEPAFSPTITSSGADMCNGDTRALIGTPTGGTWNIISGPGTILGSTLTATGPGSIIVEYSIINSCGSNDTTQTILVSNSIAVSITSSTTSFCEDLTRTLTGTPTGGMWNVISGPATESGGILTPNGSGTVSVEYAVTSSCGSGADTVDIVINPIPNASAGLDENICTGDTVTLTATGGGTYQWNPGTAVASQQVFPIVTTGYRVDVTSDSGCIASDTVTVFVQTSGTASAQNDQAIAVTGVQEIIDIYTNDVGGINSLQILGGPSNGIGVISGGNILYTSTTGYIGTDSIQYEICDANCQVVCDTAYLIIEVENDLTIPIGISVNGDGKNDVFNILGLSKYPNNSLFIYNRWGSIVFEAQPYLNDWAGQSKNGEVVEGTYFYVLKLKDDLPTRNGYIELKK